MLSQRGITFLIQLCTAALLKFSSSPGFFAVLLLLELSIFIILSILPIYKRATHFQMLAAM
jgi:hypothetical protein